MVGDCNNYVIISGGIGRRPASVWRLCWLSNYLMKDWGRRLASVWRLCWLSNYLRTDLEKASKCLEIVLAKPKSEDSDQEWMPDPQSLLIRCQVWGVQLILCGNQST